MRIRSWVLAQVLSLLCLLFSALPAVPLCLRFESDSAPKSARRGDTAVTVRNERPTAIQLMPFDSIDWSGRESAVAALRHVLDTESLQLHSRAEDIWKNTVSCRF
jgi:hypothetical protein